MDKNSILRLIAEKGYDVGYSAKLHFSTYDIVEKAPGWISLISLIVGILSLIFLPLADKYISALMTILGISGLYITYYSEKKTTYFKAGQELTRIFNSLKKLYLSCKSSNDHDFSQQLNTLQELETEFNNSCLDKHIFLASWAAHKKFFWEHQISWINEQLDFKFWRDKIPFSAYAILLGLLTLAILYACSHTDKIKAILGCQ